MFSRKLTKEELELLDKIVQLVAKEHSKCEGHDYSHILAVTHYAVEIANRIPLPVDPFVLVCGALFHDIGRVDSATGQLHGLKGASITDEFFSATWVSPETAKMISRIVIRHTVTSMMPPETVEEKIVYDADGLDRLGLIGMVRGLMGKQGTICEILEERMEKRIKDYDKLYFQESRELGKTLNEETMQVVRAFKKALNNRFKTISAIPLPK